MYSFLFSTTSHDSQAHSNVTRSYAFCAYDNKTPNVMHFFISLATNRSSEFSKDMKISSNKCESCRAPHVVCHVSSVVRLECSMANVQKVAVCSSPSELLVAQNHVLRGDLQEQCLLF